jgi:hypothetical protein
MRSFAFVLALVLAAPAAFAQPPGATAPTAPVGPGPGAQPPPGGGQQQTRRDRIKNRIRALRAYKLTEELALDEATAGRLFPLLARYDNEFDRLLGERADIQRRLAQASQGRDARAADKIIDEAAANQRAFWDMEDKRLGEVRKILSSQQTARLLVVLPPLERKIENQLRKAIQGKGGGGAGAGAGRRGARAAPPPNEEEEDGDDAQLPARR